MLSLHRRCGEVTVRVGVSERSDGDFAQLEATRCESMTLLHQCHGAEVVRVEAAGAHCDTQADAAWTTIPGATLAIRTADCVPVALYGQGTGGRVAVAAVHAGWRGLLGGVIEATLAALARQGFGGIRAIVGPHICGLHYEFGTDDLSRAVAALGSAVAVRTSWGTPALDLAQAVRQILIAASVKIDAELGRCTASDPRYFSHRGGAESGRTALLVCLVRGPAGNTADD